MVDTVVKIPKLAEADMLRADGKHRQKGLPREPASYRTWRRKNAVRWYGVLTDAIAEHAPLVKKVSIRGEVHYQRKASEA